MSYIVQLVVFDVIIQVFKQKKITVGDSSTATPLVSDLCGTSATPTHYSTTQRHAYIRLVTDASVSRAGIKLEFLAAKDYCRFITILI